MIKPAIIYCFLGQMIWLHGGVLKRGVIKKTEKTFWERECGRMLRMGEGCEDNCVPCNSQQQMISAEADFSNHADRVPVLWVVVNISSQISPPFTSGSMTKVAKLHMGSTTQVSTHQDSST